jgi:hypothetical protein
MRPISELVLGLIDGGFESDPRFADPRLLRRLRTVRGSVLTLTAAVPIATVPFVAMGAWFFFAINLIALRTPILGGDPDLPLITGQ